MKVIHKFLLDPIFYQKISLPKGAQILSIQEQKLVITLWALVNQMEAQKEDREFIILPTGQRFDPLVTDKFLGTVQLHGGELVMHVFERG